MEMTAYCNRYGFIFQGSEIYGGLANTWDYGPLGTRLKQRNKYNQYNTLEEIHDVILVMDNGQVVGCGSFKRYDEKVADTSISGGSSLLDIIQLID